MKKILSIILVYKLSSIAMGNIAILDLESQRLNSIDLDLKDVEEPEWSPNGSLILFDSSERGNRDIYVANPDGSDVTQLTDGPAKEDHGSWSSDGAMIAYQHEEDGNTDVYTMNSNGTGKKRLTFHSSRDGWPDWSPDGKQIVFSSERDGHREIYIMNTDGSNQRRLTSTNFSSTDPTFSPDGSMIAFSSDRSGESEIYTMKPDGREVTQITDDEYNYERPDWSPDGNEIIYSLINLRTQIFEIHSIALEGKVKRRLSPEETSMYRAHWSPNGVQVVSEIRPYRQPQVEAETVVGISPDILDEYTGRYRINERPDMVVVFSRVDARFFGQINEGPREELLPVSETDFILRNRPGNVTFLREGGGVTTQASINLGQPMNATRIVE